MAGKRKPKLGISKDTFDVGERNTIDICGISFGPATDDIAIGLSAKNYNWSIVRINPHTNSGVRVVAIPTRKRVPDAGRPTDEDGDLTITIIPDDGTSDPPPPTEITYDDIVYEGYIAGPSAKKKTAKKKTARKKTPKKGPTTMGH